MGIKRIIIAFAVLTVSLACSMPYRLITWDEHISIIAEKTVQANVAEKNATANTPTAIQATATATEAPEPTSRPRYPCDDDRNYGNRPCYYALLIAETIPDGSDFEPGETFLKQWTLRNTGSCTWQPDMRLVFTSGNQMEGPDSVRLDEYVEPGEYSTFMVDLEAPQDEGRYNGYWMLQTAKGYRFAKIYVKIDVE